MICKLWEVKNVREKLTFEYCDNMVADFEKVIDNPIREKSSVYYTGVDLGTACVVVAVLDENKRPVCRRVQIRGCGA